MDQGVLEMRICFYIKKEQGFYATYSTIRFDAHGKPVNFPVVVDYFEDIEVYPKFDYIVHCKSGILFKNIENFINSLPPVNQTKNIYQEDYPEQIYTLANKFLSQEFNAYNTHVTHALWVLNNHPEQIKFWPHYKFVAPASGTMWMLQIINPVVDEIKLYDISTTQVDFANALLNNWDGDNYGRFTVDFIKKHNVKNVHICQSFGSYQEYLDTINNDVKLEKIINERFFMVMPNNFAKQWQQNKLKKITILHDNILNHINQSDEFVWCRGNCINYKYTLLNTTDDLLEKFSAYDRILNTLGNKLAQ